MATLTAFGNFSGLHPVRSRDGEMHSSGRMPPMPQRSTTRTRALLPGFTRAGASRSKRLAQETVRTL